MAEDSYLELLWDVELIKLQGHELNKTRKKGSDSRSPFAELHKTAAPSAGRDGIGLVVCCGQLGPCSTKI